MRFIVMFVTAVCVLFLIKLRWPKKKNFYDTLFTALEGGQPLLTASEENITMTFLTMCNHKGTTTIYSSDSV